MILWIKDGLAKPGKTQRGLAKALNIDPAGVSRLLKGERNLRAAEIAKVAQYLGEDAPVAPTAPAPAYPDAAPFQPQPVPAPQQLRGGLPVYGTAACHNAFSHQAFELQGDVIDRVKYPPALTNIKNAYALYAAGDSMEPRYYEGELVYVHPGKPPVPGSFVVVQLRPETEGGVIAAMIKRLVRRSPSKVTLEQFNPAECFDVPTDHIHAIHRILNGEELM